MKVTGLWKEPDEEQNEILTMALSFDTLKVVDNLRLSKEDRKKPVEVLIKLEEFVNGQINEFTEQHFFLRTTYFEIGLDFRNFLRINMGLLL